MFHLFCEKEIRALYFDEKADEADCNCDVENPGDYRGRRMEESEMDFQLIVVRSRCSLSGPEKRIVVGKGGEEHAQEEAYSWNSVSNCAEKH